MHIKRMISRLICISVSDHFGVKLAVINMKVILISALFIVAALAAPPRSGDQDAVILRYESDNIGIDGYNYAYETSNGISASEQGQLQKAGTQDESIAVRGQFSFTAPDGQVYTVTYIADDNGFQPQGAHLPQGPQ